jgi:hypothetical protein
VFFVLLLAFLLLKMASTAPVAEPTSLWDNMEPHCHEKAMYPKIVNANLLPGTSLSNIQLSNKMYCIIFMYCSEKNNPLSIYEDEIYCKQICEPQPNGQKDALQGHHQDAYLTMAEMACEGNVEEPG